MKIQSTGWYCTSNISYFQHLFSHAFIKKASQRRWWQWIYTVLAVSANVTFPHPQSCHAPCPLYPVNALIWRSHTNLHLTRHIGGELCHQFVFSGAQVVPLGFITVWSCFLWGVCEAVIGSRWGGPCVPPWWCQPWWRKKNRMVGVGSAGEGCWTVSQGGGRCSTSPQVGRLATAPQHNTANNLEETPSMGTLCKLYLQKINIIYTGTKKKKRYLVNELREAQHYSTPLHHHYYAIHYLIKGRLANAFIF